MMTVIANIANILILVFVTLANLSYYLTIRSDAYRRIKLWYGINSFIALLAYGYVGCTSNTAILVTFILSATMAGGTLAACARAVDIYRVDPIMALLSLPVKLLLRVRL